MFAGRGSCRIFIVTLRVRAARRNCRRPERHILRKVMGRNRTRNTVSVADYRRLNPPSRSARARRASGSIDQLVDREAPARNSRLGLGYFATAVDDRVLGVLRAVDANQLLPQHV